MKKRIIFGFAFVIAALLITLGSRWGDLVFFYSIVFVPLILLLPEMSLKGAFGIGFLFGFMANAGILYWLYPMNYNATHSITLSIIVLSSFVGYQALFYALWAFGVRATRVSSWLRILLIPALWVTLEYVHTYWASGLPWAIIGVLQWKFITMIQISEFTGIYGVSFLVLFINAAVAESLMTRKWNYAGTAAVIFILVNVYGFVRMRHFIALENPQYSVAVVQSSIDQYKKWDKAFISEIKATIAPIVREAAKQTPDLVIWPETAAPGIIPVDKEMMLWLENLVRESKTFNLVGVPYNDGSDQFYNAAVLFDPDATMVMTHFKTHLVPIAEYVPFKKYLWPYMGIYNAFTDLSQGHIFTVFQASSVQFGTTICTENFFGDNVRRMTRKGAELLINQANDGWFIGTNGHLEHFIFNVFRAIENRRTVVVSDNIGLSGMVNAAGQISHLMPLYKNTFFVAKVSLHKEITFYMKYGDAFAKLCLIFSLGILLLPLFRTSRSEDAK